MEAINERFQQLWKTQIYIDPSAKDPSKEDDLNTLFETIMDFPNEHPDSKGKGKPIDLHIAFRVAKEFQEEIS